MTSRGPSNGFESTAFAKSLLRRMMAGGQSPLYADWRDGLHPALRAGADDVLMADGVRPHDFLAARNSSMAFALNLFLPFRLGASDALGELLSEHVGRALDVERVVFEYAGPTSVLAEVAGESPQEDEKFTAVDVAVFVRDADRRTGVVFIEVKLTEGGFSACTGATSRGNHRKDVCASAELLFHDPSACYLRRPWRASRDRRYWEIFTTAHGGVRAAYPGVDGGRCPFVGDGQQIMRNHALALGLVQGGHADWWALGLVYHDRNPDVPFAWDAYALATADRANLFRVPASFIAAAGTDPTWMANRYLFEERS